MNQSYKLFVSLLATVLSLIAMVLGIILTNSVTLGFWQMLSYDAVFILAFLSILWCGLVFYGRPCQND